MTRRRLTRSLITKPDDTQTLSDPMLRHSDSAELSRASKEIKLLVIVISRATSSHEEVYRDRIQNMY